MKKYSDHRLCASLNIAPGRGVVPKCAVQGCTETAIFHCPRCKVRANTTDIFWSPLPPHPFFTLKAFPPETPSPSSHVLTPMIFFSLSWIIIAAQKTLDGSGRIGLNLCRDHEFASHKPLHPDHDVVVLHDAQQGSSNQIDEALDQAVSRARISSPVKKEPVKAAGKVEKTLKKSVGSAIRRKKKMAARVKRNRQDVMKEAKGFWLQCCNADDKDFNAAGPDTEDVESKFAAFR